MSSTTCPRCGSAASGNFCATCGASLAATACPSCGATPRPGDRFCTRCGATLAAAPPSPAPGGGTAAATPAAARSGGKDAQLGWWAAGGLLVVLIIVFAWPILNPEAVAPDPVGGPAATGSPATGASAVDLSSMTPREAADRLFDRVMRAAAAGDSVQAASFLPMALGAYERARPLDADGYYHLATLQLTAMDLEGALASAEEALADAPTHLLALYAAAQAADELGRTEAAAGYYRRILEAFDAEMASGNADYEAHSGQMQSIRAEAEAYLAGGAP